MARCGIDWIMPTPKKPIIPAPVTSPKIQRIAGIGLKTPSKLTNKQIQSLAASVEAHKEPRKNNKTTGS
jgi:hypothetical protein